MNTQRRKGGKGRKAFLGLLLLLAASTASAQDAALGRLEREMARLATIAGGKVGVAAVHIESGRTVYLNRDERFPMASTFKVPVAVQLLTRVEKGEIRLDSMVTLKPSDLHPGSGTLTQLFDDPGVALSLRNLLELMLLISDNSATDLVLQAAGGGSAVTQRLRALGVAGINVNRPTIDLIGDYVGVQFDSTSRRAIRPATRAQMDSARKAFHADARDTATPEGMALLLQKIFNGQTLNKQNTALLLDIMTRSTTGTARLKGILPPNTVAAHKTGTLGTGDVTNDVGIITLPDGAGHVVAVVFVKESTQPTETAERAIAQIGRAIYDFFLFNR